MQVTSRPQSIGSIPEEPHGNLKHETVPHKIPFILSMSTLPSRLIRSGKPEREYTSLRVSALKRTLKR